MLDGVRLYKIRNPWGKENFNGDWSDASELWTEDLKKELGYEEANDGVWFMSAKDYYLNFMLTTANPDVYYEHYNYWAEFDVDTSNGERKEVITIKSEVEQEIFISGYTYDAQHLKSSACYSKSSEQKLAFENDRIGYHELWNGHAHADGIIMAAGEEL